MRGARVLSKSPLLHRLRGSDTVGRIIGVVGSPLERWARKVDMSPVHGGCWRWTGAMNSCGYGNLCIRYSPFVRGNVQAHRFGYWTHIGPIPGDLPLDHLCRNRWCVNPWHLEPVTDRTNILRGTGMGGRNSRKTHCHNGHEYSQSNTISYRLPSGFTGRRCRICVRANVHRAKEKKRAYAI